MYAVIVAKDSGRLFVAENAEPFIKRKGAFADGGRKSFLGVLPCLAAFGWGFWRDGWEYDPPEVAPFGRVKFCVNQGRFPPFNLEQSKAFFGKSR